MKTQPDDPGPPVVPTDPRPPSSALILAVLRGLLMALGAAGISVPAALQNQDNLTQIAGAIAFLIGLSLQIWAEYRQAAAVHRAAVASANCGRAVRPVN